MDDLSAGTIDEILLGWPGPTKDQLVAVGFHCAGDRPLPPPPQEIMSRLPDCLQLGPRDFERLRQEVHFVGAKEAARRLIASTDLRLKQAIEASVAGHGPWIIEVDPSGATTFTPRGCAIKRRPGVRPKGLPGRRAPGRRQRRREHRSRATASSANDDGGDGGSSDDGDGGGAIDHAHRQLFSQRAAAGLIVAHGEQWRIVISAPESPPGQRCGDVAPLQSWGAFRAEFDVPCFGAGVGS